MTTDTRSTYPDAIPNLSEEARRLIREAADQLDDQWDLDAARGLHEGDRFAWPDGSGRPYVDELMPKLRALVGEPPIRLCDADGYAIREAARKAAADGIGPDAEVWFEYADGSDPYGEHVMDPGRCIGREWFAQDAEARVPVHFSDLPESTRMALEEKRAEANREGWRLIIENMTALRPEFTANEDGTVSVALTDADTRQIKQGAERHGAEVFRHRGPEDPSGEAP